MNLYEITFSPTGGTQRVAERLTAAIGAASLPIDLCARPESWEPPVLMAEDICVVSVPSYGGRVPASAADRIRRISGHSAMAVAVVVYGNRAYDDTLLELKDLLVDQGFRCIAAVAAVAEHSILRQFAVGRPDADDLKELDNFGRKISRIIASDNIPLHLSVPGNAPYRPLPASGMKPSAGPECMGCGRCVSGCPVGAIPKEYPNQTNADVCISCMRCISICPAHARRLDSAMLEAVAQKLGPALSGRKPNELFL